MEIKCEKCSAKCCKYVVLDIDTPIKISDFENIKGYVCHKNIEVFVDFEGVWNVRFVTRCEHLNKSNRCEVYSKRPEVCKEFLPENCTANEENEDILTFKTMSEVEDYVKNIFLRKKHFVE